MTDPIALRNQTDMHPMHNRRAFCLRDYDYTQDGAYFVTLCTAQRACLLGDIDDGDMTFNTLGCVADICCWAVDMLHPGVELDTYVIMSRPRESCRR